MSGARPLGLTNTKPRPENVINMASYLDKPLQSSKTDIFPTYGNNFPIPQGHTTMLADWILARIVFPA
jgi:hypothetical protein